MGSDIVGYVAMVSPRATIHTKVMAQKSALVRMRDKGQILGLSMTDCSMDSRGDDWVQFGNTGRPIRLHRSGRLHSLWNLLSGYPRIYGSIRSELIASASGTVYIRKPPVFDSRSVSLMRSLRRRGIRVVLEIPTYPYDAELGGNGLLQRMDYAARQHLIGAVDMIATFSDHASIFGVPCVNITNGVPFDDLPLTRSVASSAGIRMTSVSALESWHRMDRLVGALMKAWDCGDNRVDLLNIVGDGPGKEELMRIAARSPEARARIVFHGAVYGERLSAIFDETDVAVGVLELSSDRGLSSVQPLKHREYAARGVPFIYGLHDPSFVGSGYAFQLKDEDLSMDAICHWFRELSWERSAIRADAERFRWESQFELVFQALDRS